MTPNARSMLSCEKRLPLNTWNTSRLYQKVFGNQFSTFDWVASRKTWMHWFLKEDKPRRKGPIRRVRFTESTLRQVSGKERTHGLDKFKSNIFVSEVTHTIEEFPSLVERIEQNENSLTRQVHGCDKRCKDE